MIPHVTNAIRLLSIIFTVLISSLGYAQSDECCICNDPPEICDPEDIVCLVEGYCSTLPPPIPGNSPIVNICGQNIALDNPHWLGFIATSECISITITPSNCQGTPGGFTGMQAAIVSECPFGPIYSTIGNCIANPCTTNPFVLSSCQFIIGERYYILLDGCAGDICDYKVTDVIGLEFPLLFVTSYIHELSVTGPPEVCPGETAQYTIDDPNNRLINATDFKWTFNGETIQTSEPYVSLSFEGLEEGFYDLCLIDCYNPCNSILDSIIDPLDLCITIEVKNLPDDDRGTVTVCEAFLPYITPEGIELSEPGINTYTDISDEGCPYTVIYDLVILDGPDPIWSIVPSIDYNCIDLSQCISIEILEDATPPVLISWEDGEDGDFERCDLTEGTYQITVEDGNGCSSTDIITVDQMIPIELAVEVSHETCVALCNGAADLSVSAQQPYTIEWQQLQSSSGSIFDLCPGRYDLQIIDAYGCVKDTFIIINPGATIQAIDANYDNTHCNQPTTCVELILNGDADNFTYSWSNGSLESQVNCEYGAGEHSVTLTDTIGCETIFRFEIEHIADPTVESITSHETCFGDCDGEVEIIANGFGPLDYDWPGLQTNESFIGDLCPGEYTVSVSDVNKCVTVHNFTIEHGEDLPIALFEVPDTIFFIGSFPIEFKNQSEGAVSYEWDFGDGNTSNEFEPLHSYEEPGEYTVTLTVFNAFDCKSEFSVSFKVDLSINTAFVEQFGRVNVFPNPTDHIIFVEFDRPTQKNITIELVSQSGKILYKQTEQSGTQFIELPVQAYISGTYYLNIYNGDIRDTKKIIVKK